MNVFGRYLKQLSKQSCKHEDMGLILKTCIGQNPNELVSICKPITGETETDRLLRVSG